MYFGFFFLGIASAIYQFFCPSEIKRYGVASDHISATLPNLGDVAFGQLEVKLKSLPVWGTEQTTMQELFLDRYHRTGGYAKREAYDPFCDREQMQDGYHRDVLNLNYRRLDASRPVLRVVAIVLYLLGGALLAIPSLEAFFRVAGATLRDLSLVLYGTL